MTNLCEVCNKEKPVGVAASGLGAVSFSYCQSCLNSGAEPFDILVFSLSMCGSNWQNSVAEWVNETVKATLDATGRSYEELVELVQRSINEEEEYYAMLDKMREDGLFEDEEFKEENDDESV